MFLPMTREQKILLKMVMILLKMILLSLLVLMSLSAAVTEGFERQ